MIHYWYVPIVFFWYILVAYVATTRSFWLIWAVGSVPIWAVVAKYSKDIVYDGVVYDLVLTLSYTTAILYFTKSLFKFGAYQYLGLVLVLCGLFLFKKGL